MADMEETGIINGIDFAAIALEAWNGAPIPNMEKERASRPNTFVAWGRVVNAIFAARPMPIDEMADEIVALRARVEELEPLVDAVDWWASQAPTNALNNGLRRCRAALVLNKEPTDD